MLNDDCTRLVWRRQLPEETPVSEIIFYYTKNDDRVATLRLTLINYDTGSVLDSTTIDVSNLALGARAMYTVSLKNHLSPITVYYHSIETYTVDPGASYTYTSSGTYMSLFVWPSPELKLRLPPYPGCPAETEIELPYGQYVADIFNVTVVFYNAGTSSTYFNVYKIDYISSVTMTLKIEELDASGEVLYIRSFIFDDIPPFSVEPAPA